MSSDSIYFYSLLAELVRTPGPAMHSAHGPPIFGMFPYNDEERLRPGWGKLEPRETLPINPMKEVLPWRPPRQKP